MSRNIFGNYNREGRLIDAVTIVGTTPIVGPQPSGGQYLEGLDGLCLQLVSSGSSGGTVAGAWLIEASNDFSGGGAPTLNDSSSGGTWSDITALFKTPSGGAIAAVVSGGTNQFAQVTSRLFARAIRVTFTPTGGAGNVSCLAFGSGIT